MAKELLTKCPECGGELVYSEFYQISHNHKITKDGRISKKYKKEGEFHESTLLYCTNQKCEFSISEPSQIERFDEYIVYQEDDKLYIEYR